MAQAPDKWNGQKQRTDFRQQQKPHNSSTGIDSSLELEPIPATGGDTHQRRAAYAWKCIESAQKLGHKNAKEYGGHAKKLPMRIMAAGLGQALAFVYAKSHNKRHLQDLLKHLSSWVINGRGIRSPQVSKEQWLVPHIVGGNAEYLQRATDEVLAFLQWLNRFAEAEGLTDEVGDDN